MFIEVRLTGLNNRMAALAIDCIIYFYTDNRGYCTIIMDGIVPIETLNSYSGVKKMIEDKLHE